MKIERLPVMRYTFVSLLLIAAAPLMAQAPEGEAWDLTSIQKVAEKLGGPDALKEDAPAPAASHPAPGSFTPSSDWKEVVQDWEADFFGQIAGILNGFQTTHSERGDGKLRRAFHAKSHGSLTAKFKVMENLPEFARKGIFRESKTFDCWVRFSNGQGSVNADRSADVRGLAVKVFGAEGPRSLPEEAGAKTQDFLATNIPSSGTFRTPKDFLAFTTLTLGSRLTFAVKLVRELGLAGSLRAFKFVFKLTRRVRSLASESYEGGAPIRFGPYAIKFRWEPSKDVVTRRPPGGRPDHLRDDLIARLKGGETIRYDFVAQFFVNEEETPIEDGFVPWKEEVTPSIKLAELVIEPRDLESEGAKAVHEYVESLSFNPWHSMAEHRPLGATQRARRIAYEASPRFRGAIAEPGTFSECDANPIAP